MTGAERILLSAVVLLCVSMGINIFGASAYLKQRDALTTARSDTRVAKGDASLARAAAQACSASVSDLAEQAKTLGAERDAARKQAAAKAATHYARADAALTAAPSVPGDTCASAATRAQNWLAERAKGGG